MPLNKWLNSRDVIWQSGTEVPKGQALLARKKAKTGSFHFVECWTETLLLRLRTCNEPNGGWVSALEDRRDSHPACSADRDQPAARAAVGELLREPGDDARAGGAERMADGDAAALRVHLAAVDRAQRLRAFEASTAVLLRFPGLQRAEHLRGEGLVDLVDVEVLQSDAGALEHLRHRVGRGHQHAFARAGEAGIVDGGRRGVREIRLDRDAARARPLLRAEQHARGAVGERSAVAGGERAGAAAVERGLEGGELLDARVGADVVVGLQSAERKHEVGVKAAAPRLRRLLVARERELVLLRPADAPFLRHQLAVLPPGEAGRPP